MDLIAFNLGVAQRPREPPQDGENTGTLPAAASANFESPPSKKEMESLSPFASPFGVEGGKDRGGTVRRPAAMPLRYRARHFAQNCRSSQ